MAASDDLYNKLMTGGRLTAEEALLLYRTGSLGDLMFVADMIRRRFHSDNHVGWMIDRNVNITNICFSQCRFCNFCRTEKSDDAYITTDQEYDEKIRELIDWGGDQLLLQGGMNPALGLSFYTDLFSTLKKLYPTLKLHALGPPEVVHLSKKEKLSYREVLEKLVGAGLDSLPGAGAEILSDRVRNTVSHAKATTT